MEIGIFRFPKCPTCTNFKTTGVEGCCGHQTLLHSCVNSHDTVMKCFGPGDITESEKSIS